MGKIHKGGGETSIDGKRVSTDAFSLIMYGFCSNYALYPASLSFIFLSVTFNKLDNYYFQ